MQRCFLKNPYPAWKVACTINFGLQRGRRWWESAVLYFILKENHLIELKGINLSKITNVNHVNWKGYPINWRKGGSMKLRAEAIAEIAKSNWSRAGYRWAREATSLDQQNHETKVPTIC